MKNFRGLFSFLIFLPQIIEPQEKHSKNIGPESRSAIVNGYDSPDRPFYVRVEITSTEETGFCGGSVITPSRVLTAAHCFVHDGMYYYNF